MIRILFLTDRLQGGGAEKALCNLVNGLDKNRFHITVQTLENRNPDGLLVPEITYKTMNRAKTAPGRWAKYQWLRLCAHMKWIYPLYIRGDYHIEVAYLECGPTKMLSGSTNRDALKLAWVHCDLCKKPGISENRARLGKYYAAYDKVVCVSKDVRSSYADLFGLTPESVVLPNVIDEQEIHKKSLAFRPEKPHLRMLAAIGRLSYEKGFDRLIDACHILKQQGVSFGLWLVGEGPQRQALEHRIAQLRLQNCVFLTGYQENPYPYLAEADIVVCPSRTEGYSTVVTEALILGKPVVSTPCAGMTELLGDNEYGIITEDCTEGIAEGIRKLLDSSQLRNRYAQAAQLRAMQFSADASLRQTEAFLLRELEKKRKS